MPQHQYHLTKMLAAIWVTLITSLSIAVAAEQQAPEFPATLMGLVIIKAEAIKAPLPENIPATLTTAGKYAKPCTFDNCSYAKGRRFDSLQNIKDICIAEDGKNANVDLSLQGVANASCKPDLTRARSSGISLPITGQPVQGFSGIKKVGDDLYYVLQDNGFGKKLNSPDAMLMVHKIKLDFAHGGWEYIEPIFLHDPDKILPFHIINESTAQRYLTGADLDPESMQINDNKLWIGDEFGPYLLRFNLHGKLEQLYLTEADGKPVKSPDHYSITTPNKPDEMVKFNLPRSKGFEGMAQSKDGKFLYPLLEGPLWQWPENANPGANPSELPKPEHTLRILEFNIAEGKFSKRYWQYPLDNADNAIGDFSMIDDNTALVIERDPYEGDLAKTKRIYKIEISAANVNGLARKIAYIDLLNINDPQRQSADFAKNDKFSFPFECIEGMDIIYDDQQKPSHIVVTNDNNLPFSAGRNPHQADNNEIILLEVREFFKDVATLLQN